LDPAEVTSSTLANAIRCFDSEEILNKSQEIKAIVKQERGAQHAAEIIFDVIDQLESMATK